MLSTHLFEAKEDVRRHIWDVALVFCEGVKDFAELGFTRAAGGRKLQTSRSLFNLIRATQGNNVRHSEYRAQLPQWTIPATYWLPHRVAANTCIVYCLFY